MTVDYHRYEWEAAESLSAEAKQNLMWRVKSRQVFGKIGLVLLGGMIAALLLMMSKSTGGELDKDSGTFLAVIGGLMLLVFIYAFLCSGRIRRDIAADRFVWRIGYVTETRTGTKYRTGYTVVDGQRMMYAAGIRTGEQVIVVGFNTGKDSGKLASFQCYKLN